MGESFIYRNCLEFIMPATNQKQLFEELKAIRKDLDYIKSNMVDRDMILTPKEEKRLNISIEEYKKGKAISLENFKKNN